jgi:hypothetical protein
MFSVQSETHKVAVEFSSENFVILFKNTRRLSKKRIINFRQRRTKHYLVPKYKAASRENALFLRNIHIFLLEFSVSFLVIFN